MVILKGRTHTSIHSQAKMSNGSETQAPLHDISKTPTSNILSDVHTSTDIRNTEMKTRLDRDCWTLQVTLDLSLN